ncbi:MAG: carbohydrate binding domain-containing protein, partial [Ignavibacterium sp.]|nr:carbohydrate binding domain-containing protein [Ignavibacterium sp.]MDW8376353.1 carbohydrate binding domain-containing protein [Ignavibacteriales bacterium]
MKYSLKLLFLFFALNIFAQSPPHNLVINGDFENGFNCWDNPAILDSIIKHSGNYSAYFTNSHGMINQLINVQQNTNYKVTFWIYLRDNFSGDDWGGALCSVTDYNWILLGQSIFINPNNRPINKWLQFVVNFNSGNSTIVRLQIGFFGGNGWNSSFNIDDVKLFKKSQNNISPVLTNFIVDPNSGNLPLVVNMNLSGFDLDGVIMGFYFQTSDGGFYEGNQATHTFYTLGYNTITAILLDDDGAVVSSSVNVFVYGSQNFEINITSPFQGNYYETELPQISIQGTVSSSPIEFIWFNEKNHQSGFLSVMQNSFSFNLPLRYGKNDIILQARLPNDIFYKREFRVYRKPSNYSGPELRNFIFSTRQVGTFEKLEIEFDLNSVADNYWFPYEENLPPNLNTG